MRVEDRLGIGHDDDHHGKSPKRGTGDDASHLDQFDDGDQNPDEKDVEHSPGEGRLQKLEHLGGVTGDEAVVEGPKKHQIEEDSHGGDDQRGHQYRNGEKIILFQIEILYRRREGRFGAVADHLKGQKGKDIGHDEEKECRQIEGIDLLNHPWPVFEEGVAAVGTFVTAWFVGERDAADFVAFMTENS